MRRALGIAIAWAAFLAAGCAAGDGKEAVTGMVTWKGQPLETGMIRFVPQDPAVTTEQGAVITQGRFAIPREQGLRPGVYKVVISSPDPRSGVMPEAPPGERSGYPAKERLPAKYNTQTAETFEVKAGAQNRYEVAIE